MAAAESLPPPVRRRRWPLYLLALLIVLLVGGELVARYGIGLGDPPLSVADAETEYRFAPGTYHRFGYTIHYNAFSMRSDDIAPHKTDPAELRVLMVGDSIINGGVQTDDSQLATKLLQDRLTADLHRPVRVCNISAGSWGPPNQAAYLRKFGWFDADALVLVASSHDGYDVPTFNPTVGVSADFPARRPVCALWELFARYTSLGRRLTTPTITVPLKPDPVDDAGNERVCRDALDQILGHAQAAGLPTFVVFNWEFPEILAGRLDGGAHLFPEVAAAHGAAFVDFGIAQANSVHSGAMPYRDHIHPNAIGQKLLADVIEPPLAAALAKPSATRPTTATRPAAAGAG